MDKDLRTLWCGNLSNRVTEDVLYELFLQAGPLEDVKIPKDRDSRPRAYGFVTYKHDESVDYAVELFRGTCLYNRELTINRKSQPPQEQPIQQQQMLLPQALLYHNLMNGLIPPPPYQTPIGHSVPYASQDQSSYHGSGNRHPKHHQRNASRKHPYHRR